MRSEDGSGWAEEQMLFQGHPCWRSMLGFYFKGLLAAVGAGTLAGILSASSGKVNVGWIFAIVLATLTTLLLVGALRRAMTTYTITDQRLRVDIGLLSRELRELRLDRVQRVNFRQTLIERILGVGSVDFDAAPGAEEDLCFRGVCDPHAIARAADLASRKRQ